MKLKERLEQTRGIVLIGCVAGSGYFYADKANDKTYAAVLKADIKEQRKLRRRLRSCKDNAKKIGEQVPKDMEEAKHLVDELRKLKEKLKDIEQAIDNYIPLYDREVVVDELTPCYKHRKLLIDGDIRGDYWFFGDKDGGK